MGKNRDAYYIIRIRVIEGTTVVSWRKCTDKKLIMESTAGPKEAACSFYSRWALNRQENASDRGGT